MCNLYWKEIRLEIQNQAARSFTSCSMDGKGIRHQLTLKATEVSGLKNICLYLVRVNVKAWLECSSSVGAPFNDLMFIKDLKLYEKVNKGISTVGLKKISNHLWYLNEEASILAIFDKNVDIASKKRIIENFTRENLDIGKKWIIHPNEVPHLLGRIFILIKSVFIYLIRNNSLIL